MRTPDLPADDLAALPGLAAFGRTATRLHPRPGTVTAADSHVGGPLRWPADEPWPVCAHPRVVSEDVPLPQDLLDRLAAAERGRTQHNIITDEEFVLLEELAALVGPGFSGYGSMNGGPTVGHRYVSRPHDNPMLAVAQLRAADVPDLPTPGGADLLQVLWCPFDHAQDEEQVWGPTIRLVWRREADVTGPLATPPASAVGEDHYTPRTCRLHPEQIVEYPYPQELPEPLRGQADKHPDYVNTFMAPGWKVGGYAKWQLSDLLPTPCRVCAGPTRLMLVIDSGEGTEDARWRPVEEAGVDPGSLGYDADEPTGVVVGRWGALRVFMCPTCPGAPFRLDQQ
jgi:hypothetical protein